LEAWLNPNEADTAEEQLTNAPASNASAIKPNASFAGGVNSVDDIEDAFDELFS
jgi:hypothetical protein